MPQFIQTIPLLVYKDIQAAHDFLVRVFGFESGGIVKDDHGQPVHGEVRIGTTTIWMHRIAPEHNLISPLAASSMGMVVQVEDVDAHYNHTLAAGANVESEPQDQPYGQREYGVSDLEGHRWWFASPTNM